MKICRVCQSFPRKGETTNDGIAINVLFLSRQQAKNNKVVVLTAGEKEEKETYDNIEIYRIKKKKPFVLRTGPNLLKKLEKLNDQYKFDIIHVHNPIFIPKNLNKLGVPIVFTLHASILQSIKAFKLSKIHKALKGYIEVYKLTKLFLGKVDKFVCVSRGGLDEFLREYKIPKEKATVIPNGVDTKKFARKGRSDKGFVLLSVGRFIKLKAFEYLIEAMPAVLKKYPQTKLYIIGYKETDENLGTIKSLVNKLGLEEKVILLKSLNYEKLIEYYLMCDIYLQPSLSEGLPKTVLEAMAAGKPIIATGIDGHKDIVSPENGFLVPTKNSAAIEEKINLLLGSAKMRKDLGNKSKELSKNFDWENIANKYLDLYEDLIKQKKLCQI